MVVDTSAITAVLIGEPQRDLFTDLILRAPTAVISVAATVEATIVLRNKRRDYEADYLDEFLATLRVEVRAVDAAQGLLARQAFDRFGKGRHPAGLNFGDCFSYALAKSLDAALLYTGEDFARTDIAAAWRPEGLP